jgi:hypothetical protein
LEYWHIESKAQRDSVRRSKHPGGQIAKFHAYNAPRLITNITAFSDEGGF